MNFQKISFCIRYWFLLVTFTFDCTSVELSINKKCIQKLSQHENENWIKTFRRTPESQISPRVDFYAWRATWTSENREECFAPFVDKIQITRYITIEFFQNYSLCEECSHCRVWMVILIPKISSTSYLGGCRGLLRLVAPGTFDWICAYVA